MPRIGLVAVAKRAEVKPRSDYHLSGALSCLVQSFCVGSGPLPLTQINLSDCV